MYTIPRQNQSHYRIRSIESITQTTVLVALAVPPLEIARAKVAMFAMRSAMFRTKPDSSTTCLELPCWLWLLSSHTWSPEKLGKRNMAISGLDDSCNGCCIVWHAWALMTWSVSRVFVECEAVSSSVCIHTGSVDASEAV